MYCFALQPVFSNAFQTEWGEPFDFPIRMSSLPVPHMSGQLRGRSWVGDHIFKGMGMGFNKKSWVSAIMGMVRHQPLMGDGEGDNWLICRLHAQCIISNNNWRLLDEVEQNIVICQWRADRLSEAKNWSFSRKSYRKEKSTVSFTLVQNIICS